MPKTLDLLLPNHDGPAHPYSTLQIEGIVLIVVLTFIAVVAGGLRVYSRTITKTCGLDDWLVWTATVCLLTNIPRVRKWKCIRGPNYHIAAYRQPMLGQHSVHAQRVHRRT